MFDLPRSGVDQLDAAEEAASRVLDLLSEKDKQFFACQGHRTLGRIYGAKDDPEKAIHHFEAALGIASPFNWHSELFWIHFSLAKLFSGKGRFDDAHAHIQRAKPHTVNDPYLLAHASLLQALVWDDQDRPEEAKSEALRALDVFEKLGAANNAEWTRKLIRQIDAGGSGLSNGELPKTVQPVMFVNSSCSDKVTESK